MKRRKKRSISSTILISALLVACSGSETNSFDAKVVCPAEGLNAYSEPNRGTFTDERDGQVYKYTTIGNQVWMAENINIETPYRHGCYSLSLCTYALKENSTLTGVLDQNRLDSICPAGWHVPSLDEWLLLMNNMGGQEYMARLSSEFGSDDCKFSSTGYVADGYAADYWTSTQNDAFWSYRVAIHQWNDHTFLFEKNDQYMYVRCLKD